jgi:hypothetical protein
MALIANLLCPSFVNHVIELTPKYSKLMAIIALAVGRRKRIPMSNLVFLNLCDRRRRLHKNTILNFKSVSDVCDPYLA